MGTTPQRGPGMLTPAIYPVYNAAPPANGVTFANATAGPLSLAAGQTLRIPAGEFMVQPGPYTWLQFKDPITGNWKAQSQTPNTGRTVQSDGQNVRLANLTGCSIGAYVTNVGSGYTSAPTVTASAGGSTWTAIVGGAINSTVTVTTAGAGYNYPPTLLISAPPAGGVQATAVAVVSAGAISSVTVVNQGAGYTAAPTITVVPDPRDTPTTIAVLTVNATLAGAGTITAVLMNNHGLPQTAVPTLSFSGGGGASAAATVVMCFTITAFTVAVNGAGYGNAQPMLIISGGGYVAGAAGATVNPAISTGLLTPRQGTISATSTAGGIIQTSGSVVVDGGLFAAVPTLFVLAGGTGLGTTTAGATATVGGVTDTSLLLPL